MFRSPVDDDHTKFPAGAKTGIFVEMTFPRRGTAVPCAHVRCVASFRSSCHTLSTTPSPFPHYLGGRRARRPVRFLFGSSIRVCAKIYASYTIHSTSPISAPYSCYSPNTASRPSSQCTRTSGRATPAGPADLYGRLSR